MYVCLSICLRYHALTHTPFSPYTVPSPVLVGTSLLLSCQCLCELLGSYYGYVSWGASVRCLCVCMSVYMCSFPHTHTCTTQSLLYTIACPRQHFLVIVLSMPLRAPGLVLWLCVVGCISDVSVCMFVCLSVFVITHSHIHHSAPTPCHRLSSSALLCYCLVNASASSWARTMAMYRGVHQ